MQFLHEGQLGLGMDIHHMLMDITGAVSVQRHRVKRQWGPAQTTTTVLCQLSKFRGHSPGFVKRPLLWQPAWQSQPGRAPQQVKHTPRKGVLCQPVTWRLWGASAKLTKALICQHHCIHVWLHWQQYGKRGNLMLWAGNVFKNCGSDSSHLNQAFKRCLLISLYVYLRQGGTSRGWFSPSTAWAALKFTVPHTVCRGKGSAWAK